MFLTRHSKRLSCLCIAHAHRRHTCSYFVNISPFVLLLIIRLNSVTDLFSDKDEDLKARDDLRRDRMKERQRDRNLARAAPDKR